MATFPETKVFEGLAEHLKALVFVPVIPISWPNRNFTPPAAGGWLKVNMLPAPTSSLAIADGSNQYIGVMQVSVFWPENTALTTPSEKAGQLIAWFKAGTTLYREGVKIVINRPPYQSAPLPEPSWLQVPVTIPYLAHVPN